MSVKPAQRPPDLLPTQDSSRCIDHNNIISRVKNFKLPSPVQRGDNYLN